MKIVTATTRTMRIFSFLVIILSVSTASAREHKKTIDLSKSSTSSSYLRKLDTNATVTHKPENNAPPPDSGHSHKPSSSGGTVVSSSSSTSGGSSGSSSSGGGTSAKAGSSSKIAGDPGAKSGSSHHPNSTPLQSTGMMLVGAAVVGAVALAAVAMRRPTRDQTSPDHALMGSVERRMTLFSSIAKSGVVAGRTKHRYPEEEIDFEDKYSVMGDPIELDRSQSQFSVEFESRDEIEGHGQSRWNLFNHVGRAHTEAGESRDSGESLYNQTN